MTLKKKNLTTPTEVCGKAYIKLIQADVKHIKNLSIQTYITHIKTIENLYTPI